MMPETRKFDAIVQTDCGQASDVEILRQLSDTVWELLLDRFLAIPDLANLSLMHIRLLYWIKERAPITLQQARQEFGPSPLVTARLIGKLVRRGLLSRCGDLYDNNTVYLHLTGAGATLLARMEAYQRHSFRRFFSVLTAEELHNFADGLDLIVQYERP